MSAHNFWNNLTSGLMHGMFGNSPFFGCSWGGWGCSMPFNSCFTPMFDSNYLVPNIFSSMNFNSLMPDMSLPSLPNVSIDINKLFPTDNWMESAFNNSNFNFNFNSNISNTFNNATNNTNTIFPTDNWLKPINSNYSFSFDTFVNQPARQSQTTQNKATTKSQDISFSSVKPAKMTGNSVNDKYFDKMLSHLLSWEGGYANDPDESGGETNKGVTHTTYDGYRRKKGLPLQNVRYITDAEVKDIYYEIFKDSGADKIDNPRMALMVFDTAVGSGCAKAKELFRKSDGSLEKYEQLRREWYADIVKRKPKNKKFIKGWNNRVTDMMKFAKNNLPETASA